MSMVGKGFVLLGIFCLIASWIARITTEGGYVVWSLSGIFIVTGLIILKKPELFLLGCV